MVGQEAPRRRAVGEPVKGVMHEDHSQTREGIALVVCEVSAQLVFSQKQPSGICVIPTEPRGIQAYDVNWEREAEQLHG